jgi:radical SAM protein with 4Fe4S-binding SPASM domain
LAPAPWVSWRAYRIPDGHRTLILNQRSSEFLLLEDLSSLLWASIVEQPRSARDVATDIDLTVDEVSAFAQELADAGLLASGESGPDGRTSKRWDQESADNLEHEMLSWTENQGFVFAAHWEMTYRCNERCVHCYNPGAAHKAGERSHRERNELTTEEGKRLLEELAELGVFRLTLSGGEATLRKDFVDLLAYARRLGFQVVIYTNGLKISDEVLREIGELHPYAVEVSIYSASPEQHDEVTRVNGSFRRSMKTLEYFRALGVRTVFKTSLTKTTIGNWRDTLALGERTAETALLSTIISPGVDGQRAPLYTAPDFGQLVEMAATPGSPLYVGGPESDWGRTAPLDRNKKPCGAGHSGIAVTPDGDIYPCISLPIRIGSFRTDGVKHLKRVPESGKATSPSAEINGPAKILDRWRSVRIHDLTDCGRHEHCNYCGDLCPGDAFVQTGDPLKAAENHCRQARARMTASQVVKARLPVHALPESIGNPVGHSRSTRQDPPTIPV